MNGFVYQLVQTPAKDEVAPPPTVIEADDDQKALALAAESVPAGAKAAVWLGNRLVGQVGQDASDDLEPDVPVLPPGGQPPN